MTLRAAPATMLLAVVLAGACGRSSHTSTRGSADPGPRPSSRPPPAPSATPKSHPIATHAGKWRSIGIAEARVVAKDGGVRPLTDAGRVDAIRVDPRDHGVVYIATPGGLFKSAHFGGDDTAWTNTTAKVDTVSAIAAFDLDPSHPDHLFAGAKYPAKSPAGHDASLVLRSEDGGKTWSQPTFLDRIARIRDVSVDPTSSKVVLVATEKGLYRSEDGGARYEVVDLPDVDRDPEDVVYDIAYLGEVDRKSHWLVSATRSCLSNKVVPELKDPNEEDRRPGVKKKEPARPSPCKKGANGGDIFRSTDGGKTWKSLRAEKRLPTRDGEGGIGPIALAVAGDAKSPDATVVYAVVGDAAADAIVDVFRSTDGGKSFVSARGKIENASSGCKSIDVADKLTGYARTIVVDAKDPAHVIVAGTLCALRTLDGLAASPAWEPIAAWTPGEGRAPCGTLPYVHADYHAALSVADGSETSTLLGTDGGIFVSKNAFAAKLGRACDVAWRQPDKGLANQMVYSIGSGDSADGNEAIVISGMQDIGPHLRDADKPELWNAVGGAEGGGTAVLKTKDAEIYWIHNGGRRYCKPKEVDCRRRTLGWKSAEPPVEPKDTESWSIPYSLVATDPRGSLLTATKHNVYRVDATPTYTKITGKTCEDGKCAGGGFANEILGVAASPTIPGLYGVTLLGQRCAVTSDGDSPSPTWTISKKLPNATMGMVRSIAFSPVVPPGKKPGDVYLCGRTAASAEERAAAWSVESLFVTQDRGATFTSMHAASLPREPVNAVRYDPADASGKTLYVATTTGVFRSKDAGESFQRYGEDLPRISVTDLFVSKRGDLLRAATFGLGVWELSTTD